jgi:Sulfotransferase family
VQSEGHILWDEFHHPRDRSWSSDALGPDDVTDRERRYVYCAIRLVVRGRRFVDKTPESCLRIGYLDALFPDPTFVFLRRRAAPNIASLVEAWKARPRFVKYRLPEPLTGLGELNGSQWSFALVPGWRELKGASLEEICAAQYAACNQAALEARDRIAPDRWIDIFYEDLVAQPTAALEALYAKLGLAFGERARAYAARLADNVSRTALAAPHADKWREREDTIERVLPSLAELERRLGYA